MDFFTYRNIGASVTPQSKRFVEKIFDYIGYVDVAGRWGGDEYGVFHEWDLKVYRCAEGWNHSAKGSERFEYMTAMDLFNLLNALFPKTTVYQHEFLDASHSHGNGDFEDWVYDAQSMTCRHWYKYFDEDIEPFYFEDNDTQKITMEAPVPEYVKALAELSAADGNTELTAMLQKFSEKLKEQDARSSALKYDRKAFLISNGVLKKYKGTEAEVVIPDGVKEIGNRAFEGSNITSVVIPEGVTIIDDYAFSDCLDLERVVFPKSLRSIGDFAFQECEYLCDVELNEGLEWVGKFAFTYGIKNLVFPASLDDMDLDFFFTVFIDLRPDAVIYAPAGSKVERYAKENGIPFVAGKPKPMPATKTESAPKADTGDFDIENGLLKKYNGSGGDVVVPKGVTIIGNFAFSGCGSLTGVTLPEGVTSIGGSSFKGCKSLTDVVVPKGVTIIGYAAFYDCESLTSITLPESVTSIGDYAFKGCENLTIHAPAGSYAEQFAEKNAIQFVAQIVVQKPKCKPVTKSKSVPKADADGFAISNGVLIKYKGSDGNITVPGSVTSIGDKAFSGCKNLMEVMLPKGVTRIGNEAFKGCASLTGITLPDSLTSIGELAFSGCKCLTGITLSESVTSIGNEAFKGCKSLTIHAPAGSYAEQYAEKEKNYTIENGLLKKYKGSGGKVVVPEGVTSIGDKAFKGCKGLTDVTLPEGVTSIGEEAFDGCASLTDVTLPKGLTSIGKWAFSGCVSLTSITVPEGVTFIGGSAFDGCKSLTDVTVSENVTRIGWKMFKDCTSLTSITLPKSVTNIDRWAFENCKTITIHAPAGSYAEQFAKGCRIPFEATE